MRFDYVQYDNETQAMQENFKGMFKQIDRLLELIPDGRAKSLALTRLEESYMWVGKALRDTQLHKNNPTTTYTIKETTLKSFTAHESVKT